MRPHRTESAPSRVAVIGYGHYGALHAATVRADPDSELVAVVDTDPDAIERAGRDLDDVRLLSDVRELPAIETAVVATTDDQHLAPALAALDLGADVLIEKPVTTQLADADRLRKRASSAGRHVAVGHLLRLDPRWQWLRQQLRSTSWGDALHISLLRNGSVDLRDRYPDVSPMMQGGIHDIDLATWLLDDPLTVVSCRTGVDDVGRPAVMTLLGETSRGATVVIEASRTLDLPAPVDPRTWAWLTTSRATATASDGDALEVTGVAPPPHRRASTPQQMIAAQWRDFLRLTRGEGATSIATLEQGRHAVAAALAAEASAACDGEPIEIT
ncbi:Gfo/Idh/MocA family protein [Pseudactinotalea suaedae]|uniref:Gfo/Idh/MocA family protein n=1 Tax=Pseudactinotalea suaedae TaxID=1524924 RepID=UPI0012E319FE|nr:Gfo/Idh/MocA family oxidoreductase [Pseudactinotalea suaedae]